MGLLQAKYDEMQALADAGDLKRLVEKDIEFHREVCRLSGNGRLLKLWSSLASQIRLFLVLTDQVYFEPQYIVETHRPILEAMYRRDHAAAEEEIKQHLAEAAETIVQGMRDLSRHRLSRSPNPPWLSVRGNRTESPPGSSQLRVGPTAVELDGLLARNPA